MIYQHADTLKKLPLCKWLKFFKDQTVEQGLYDGESIQKELQKYIGKYGEPTATIMADDLTKKD
jgi:hypothetical protein